jgi:hypothetical protein
MKVRDSGRVTVAWLLVIHVSSLVELLLKR